MREWERRIRGWRARERKWRGAIVDSESHLASRLLFIVPCYSGFPRQSGRDAIKKRKQERRTRGRGGRESSCWGKSAWARNEMSGIGWNKRVVYRPSDTRLFYFFSSKQFWSKTNTQSQRLSVSIAGSSNDQGFHPRFRPTFPRPSTILRPIFFSFSKSEFPKRLIAEKESLYRSMLEKNKYVKKRERRRIFFSFSFNESRSRVMNNIWRIIKMRCIVDYYDYSRLTRVTLTTTAPLLLSLLSRWKGDRE